MTATSASVPNGANGAACHAAHDGGAAAVGSPDLALWVENVTVSFDGFKALNDLTLLLDRGELRCIIGPNGAGKTTLMDVITGKTRPDTGNVLPRQPAQRSDRALGVPDRADGHRPQVPAADRVSGAHGLRELRARAAREQGRLAQPVRAPVRRAARAHRRGPRDRRARPSARTARRAALARPEAVAGDRHAARAGAASACSSTSRSPA